MAKKKKSSKLDMLNMAMKKIKSSFGEEKIGTLREKKDEMKIEFIKTKSSALNKALNGGLAKGKISEIYGPSQAGKTSTLLETIGYNMSLDPEFVAGWFETEGHFDYDYAVGTFNIDPDRFIVWSMEDEGAEDGLDMLESILRSGALDILVVNTVAGLTPKSEIDAKMAKMTIGLQARMMSKLMRKLTAVTNRLGTHISFVNQIRSDINATGSMGTPTTTTGGAALSFYASQRIYQKIGFIKEEDKSKGYNQDEFKKIDVQIRKNRLATGRNAFQKCTYFVEYGVGTDVVGEIPTLVEEYGILKKSGAWFYDLDDDGEVKVRNGKPLKWQGRGAFRKYLLEDTGYYEELRERIENIGVKEIDQVSSMSEEEIEKAEKEELEAQQKVEELEAED
jgi:recombination protein RecA